MSRDTTNGGEEWKEDSSQEIKGMEAEILEGNLNEQTTQDQHPSSSQSESKSPTSSPGSRNIPCGSKVHMKMLKNLRFSRKGNNSLDASDTTSKKNKTSSSGWPFKLCSRAESAMSLEFTDCASGGESLSRDCVCTGYKRKNEDCESSSHLTEEDARLDETERSRGNDSIASLLPFLSRECSSPSNRIEGMSSRAKDNTRQQYPHPSSSHHDSMRLEELDLQVLDPGSRATSSTVLQNTPVGYRSPFNSSVEAGVRELAIALRNQLSLTVSPYPYLERLGESSSGTPVMSPGSSSPTPLNPIQLREQQQQCIINRLCQLRLTHDRTDGSFSLSDVSSHLFPNSHPIHTQVDYVHRLVPDLLEITNCSFYWGKMDRYEAEKLLHGKPEGSFLLRDSAQEQHLFSVSFRRFDRTLHARIEQYNHRFSFDSHDPGVFAANTVCGLIEHYKDPVHCMFFEPMLTIPLHRKFPFSLQDLTRATLCSYLTYDSVNLLPLPKKLKCFLKEYHYKQQVRVRRFD